MGWTSRLYEKPFYSFIDSIVEQCKSLDNTSNYSLGGTNRGYEKLAQHK